MMALWLARLAPYRLMIELGLAAVLIMAVLFYRGEASSARAKVTAVEAASKTLKAEHGKELEEARGRYEEEIRRLRADAVEPGQPVRLCVKRPASETPRPPAAGSSAPGGGVQPVSGGDTVAGPEPGPDIHPLLKLFAFQCERVAGELREQQGVR
jgi:hypothetical protein